MHQTFLITINLQIIRFRWIIQKQVYAKNIEGGPISNLRFKNQPVMQLETLSISSRIKKEGGCFAKTVFETKRQDVTIMQTIH